jgi:hypothetical protein
MDLVEGNPTKVMLASVAAELEAQQERLEHREDR